MKWPFPILALAAAVTSLAATVGDTYDNVIAEKGKPVGIMSGGSLQILTYPDAVIKVKDGVVVSVRLPDKVHAVIAENPMPAAAVSVRRAPADQGSSYDFPAVWEADLGAGLEQAKARKCHVLVLFTGSDWCTWCHKMDAEVYSRPEFAAYTHEKFVLVKLDYPHHTPQPDDVRVQNAEMLRRYRVNGFPNAVIVDENARALVRFEGYTPGGAASFIHKMQPYE